MYSLEWFRTKPRYETQKSWKATIFVFIQFSCFFWLTSYFYIIPFYSCGKIDLKKHAKIKNWSIYLNLNVALQVAFLVIIKLNFSWIFLFKLGILQKMAKFLTVHKPFLGSCSCHKKSFDCYLIEWRQTSQSWIWIQ